MILDLSFNNNDAESAINEHIKIDYYFGEKISIRYPSVDDLTEIIREKGKGCHMFKRDLKRAYIPR